MKRASVAKSSKHSPD